MNPDLINYEIKDIPQMSEIRTEEVEPMNPQTSRTRNFKFKVSNTGFLDGTSMITFKLQKTATAEAHAAGADRLRVNLWNGVLGAIKSAVLKVGDFEICNTQGLDRISTLRHLNKPQSIRNGLFGFYLGNNLDVFIETIAGNANQEGGDRGVGQIRPHAQRSGINFGQQDDGTGKAVNNLSIVTDSTKNEKYGIPLYMLFTCLENRQLPLFLFQDYPVILEVEFNEASAYVNNIGYPAAGGYVALDTDIAIDEPKLVVDYVLPPSSVINSYIDQTSSQGYRFEYPKINRVIKTIPAAEDNVVQEVEHRLGQEGREIHKIYQLKRYSKATDPLKDAVLGKKVLLDQSIDGSMIEEYNVEINGKDVFSDFVYNNASQYNKVAQTLDEPLHCPRSMFYTDVNTQWAGITNQITGLKGTWKPLAVDLRNGMDSIVGGGTPVMRGSSVVWKYRREGKPELTNVNVDQKPAMDVEYHIVRDGTAIIKKLAKGTSVVVSA